ncbi:MAG: carboxypeptidase-like regulatory domain-containing protein [Blastocatellia bacterium]
MAHTIRKSVCARLLVLFALFFWLTATGVAQQPTPEKQPEKQEAPKTGSIKGRVAGEDGQPIAGIPVMAIPVGRNAARRQAAAPAIQTGPAATVAQTVTDEDGNFEFTNLAPASYAISASTPGYVAPLPEDSPKDSEESKAEDAPRRALYQIGDTANITLVKGGVITGKVTSSTGETLTGVTINAIRTGNLNGEPDELGAARGFGRAWRTDDRGEYRIYGLVPGTYIVQAGQLGQGGRPGGGGPGAPLSPYSQDAPTYYPSSSRDAAMLLPIRAGEELTGIDIRYRAEKGRTVGGKVTIAQASKSANPQSQSLNNRGNNPGFAEIRLTLAGTDTIVATTIQPLRNQPANQPSNGFAIYAIPDGEYDITARLDGGATESDSVSEVRRISVHGVDVGGILLPVSPLASISGKILLEKATANSAAACFSSRRSFLEETLLTAQRDEPIRANQRSTSQRSIPTANGDFLIRNLEAGRWRLSARLPDDNWYVRAMSSATPTAVAAVRKPANAATAAALPNLARNGAALKPGEKLTNITVTISEGAAGLKGSTSATGKLQIHLIPAEKENADEVLRYSQANLTGEGVFQFKHIAPGRYFVLAKPGKDNSTKLVWDSAQRAALRKEAEAAGKTIELTACQRVNDFKLKQ